MEKLGTYSKARGRWKGGKDREGQSFFPLADPRPKKRKGKEGWALHSSRTRRAKEFTHEEVLGWWFVRTTTPTNSRSKATTRTDDGAWACLSCGIRAMLETEALRKERMRRCSRCRFKILTAPVSCSCWKMKISASPVHVAMNRKRTILEKTPKRSSGIILDVKIEYPLQIFTKHGQKIGKIVTEIAPNTPKISSKSNQIRPRNRVSRAI